jgi:nucleoid DNA-binding protein
MIVYSLRNYLKKHKKLSLHGIGHFVLEEAPAQLDFTAKLLYPPVSEIKFEPESQPNNNQFFNFLSRDLKVDKITSVKLYNEEMHRIKEALVKDGEYNLNGIGILSKHPNDVIGFTKYDAGKSPLPVIAVERVIRRAETHTIRVGEDERTNKHMEELLAQPEAEKKSYWWMYLIIVVLVIAIIFLLFTLG